MKSNVKNLSIFTIVILLFSFCVSLFISQKSYNNGLYIDCLAGKDKKADSPKEAKTMNKNHQVEVLGLVSLIL
jgi:hypothetical protein